MRFGDGGGHPREVPHNEAVSGFRLAALMAAPMVAGLAACSTSTGSPTAKSSATGSPGTGCVSHDQAVQVWTDIDKRINAIELDPKHAGVSGVASGQALQLINEYLQMQLVSSSFTEREVDKLESLSVVDAGCNGGDLQVQVTEKVVQDDYLRPDGTVDHPDPAVGSDLTLVETFVRSGSTWKESNFRDLTQPTSTPQLF